MKVSLATGHFLCYAPQYAAAELGYFEEEGLTLNFVDPPRPGLGLVDAVESGAADFLLGTVWFSLATSGTGSPMLMIGESNRQCHHALAGAHPQPAFSWPRIPKDAVILVPTDAPTPWVALTNGLRMLGVSQDSIRLVPGLSERDCVNQILAGVGDYAILQLETITLTDGLHEIATVAEAAGPIPWSVYCAPEATLQRLTPELAAFMSGLRRALPWVYSQPTSLVAETLAPRFPATSVDAIGTVIDRYRSLRLWTDDGRVEPDSADRWGRMLLQSGLLRAHVPAETMIRDAHGS
jgi:NitT/TauT family transport system substrate-binding protein